ncbi:metal ABC transporter permease [Xanthomonas prunicola]|uniref:Metal ABC transporter permease n=1 Tax=Xanthomonas prunicola TaxID=2053930 RepID=A0A9Q9IZB4_9XANT|nr:metal ABC transporter permease [Xanthomonas prunicola]USJ01258.1 metal ABC transporter permease [Xanthomonas prunicola]UXA49791.1 metal ABC transporter permease [Xanthomonas prunicola]UXA52516.1 metal ABC transporter permease [Xanthomonas prunicola]UXA58088.1 metal ABC transporter permease [Xanthomonas prunicola]UXA60237.1 metal ABC transporter permease [Xanthomonas prunicola]
MTLPWQPFLDYVFMQRALLGCTAIALGATPIGVFLIARRMSLIGDAMAHAILPGAAVGFVMCGLSLGAMTLGGSIAGLLVAVLTGAVSRATRLQEDASLAAFYLISLALGVLLVSLKGSNVDLMHVLFGSVLALDDDALLLLCTIATLTVIVLAMLYRPLVLECVDPQFLRTVGRSSLVTHQLFLALVVLNLVAGFQALGTLMAVGIMILPAATARFWARRLAPMLLIALAVALLASVTGLLLSYRFDLPSGPTIILAAGTLYLLSLLLGPEDSLAANARPRTPRDAAGESP